MNTPKKKNFSLGFTLTEMLVVITVFLCIIISVYSAYSLSHRAYRKGESAAETVQNGRVILERMTRELRQAAEIVTELSDDEMGSTSTIMFRDGHDSSSIQYIHYFLEGANVKREKIAYYFSGDPSTFVLWNVNPPGGEDRVATTTEPAKVIGEYVDSLGFWGSSIVNVSTTLEKGEKKINFKTQIFGRNL